MPGIPYEKDISSSESEFDKDEVTFMPHMQNVIAHLIQGILAGNEVQFAESISTIKVTSCLGFHGKHSSLIVGIQTTDILISVQFVSRQRREYGMS
jgi:hypothetical protein